MRIFIASIFTLLLLSGFVMVVFLSLLYFLGFINAFLLIILTILINFILWLISPTIADFIYQFLYKMRWMSLEELSKRSKKSYETILRICKKYNFKIPKLGIINDKNPNAFTYGSGRWNARIIVTEGIFEYLDDNEISSVYAHELGHIKNRDFIIMTIASTLLQILYESYVISRRLANSRSSGRRKGGGQFLIIMIISYIFYWIGKYVVLYLSRIREYYADEFSAKETSANYLSSALIKICYGILVNPDDVRLVNSTKYLGIADFKMAESIGLVYYNCKNLNDFKPLLKTLLYDIKNPWAFLVELNSTHPLVGKRLKRLTKFSKKPLFDFENIEEKIEIDKNKMYSNFIKDILVLTLSSVPPLLFFIIYFVSITSHTGFLYMKPMNFFGILFILLGLSIILITLYRYPKEEYKKANILEVMSDLYASPIRGKTVELEGEIIGRGVPGLIFSEDMMMKDKTGLMFLNYESWLPIIGNIFFGLSKVPKLLNKEAKIKGWFIRGIKPMVVLDKLETKEEKLRGFAKLGSILGGFILISIGFVLLIL